MADRHIKSNPQRDKDIKDKTDFATQSFPHSEGIILPNSQTYKKEIEEKVEVAPKNWNVNFIEDEVFEKEKVYLPYHPQGESVILIAPKLKLPTKDIQLLESTKKELLNEELNKLAPGYRVVAVSPYVLIQQAKPVAELLELFSRLGLDSSLDEIGTPYAVGDYVFSPAAPIREMNFIQPEDENLSYYEVFHREIRGHTTQAQVLPFKPQVKDGKSS